MGYATTTKSSRPMSELFSVKTISIIVIAFVAFIIVVRGLWGSVGTIQAGDTGVVTQFGAVQHGDLKHEGMYVVTPWIQKVHEINTRPNKIDFKSESAVTKDRQEVSFDLSLIVQTDPSVADTTYENYRDGLIDTIVMPKVLEAAKTVTARYDAATQVQNRALVQSDMLSYIQHETAGKGVIIGPGALSITNFAYNAAYQDAIEATAVSQQNQAKALADLAVAKTTAQQKVAEARGVADSNALLSRTVTPKTIQLEFIKKWDGKLPAVMGGSSNIMDLSKMVGN